MKNTSRTDYTHVGINVPPIFKVHHLTTECVRKEKQREATLQEIKTRKFEMENRIHSPFSRERREFKNRSEI